MLPGLPCSLNAALPCRPSHGARRVCIVNSSGTVLLDRMVAQAERVTDYRTRWSGIRPRDLAGAPPLAQVRPLGRLGMHAPVREHRSVSAWSVKSEQYVRNCFACLRVCGGQ